MRSRLTTPEIRNMIYDYAAQNPITLLRNTSDCCAEACNWDNRVDARPLRRSDVQERTQFFGLLQVCRQIRKEFRPMYMARGETIADGYYWIGDLDDEYPFVAVAKHNCHAISHEDVLIKTKRAQKGRGSLWKVDSRVPAVSNVLSSRNVSTRLKTWLSTNHCGRHMINGSLSSLRSR